MIKVGRSNRDHDGLKALLVIGNEAKYLCDHEPSIGSGDDWAFGVFVNKWRAHAKALGVPFDLEEGLEHYLKDPRDGQGKEAGTATQAADVR